MVNNRIDSRYTRYITVNLAFICMTLVIGFFLDAPRPEQFAVRLVLVVLSLIYMAVVAAIVIRNQQSPRRAELLVVKWSYLAMLGLAIGAYAIRLILRNAV
jgi:uncharacterized membrane protein YczE